MYRLSAIYRFLFFCIVYFFALVSILSALPNDKQLMFDTMKLKNRNKRRCNRKIIRWEREKLKRKTDFLLFRRREKTYILCLSEVTQLMITFKDREKKCLYKKRKIHVTNTRYWYYYFVLKGAQVRLFQMTMLKMRRKTLRNLSHSHTIACYF